jgi:ATP-dependent Clp protease ATP-binding subunit ClpA
VGAVAGGRDLLSPPLIASTSPVDHLGQHAGQDLGDADRLAHAALPWVWPATECGMVAGGGSAAQRAGDQTVFERFTDRARRVVVLAQEEARLLNHDYVGTEHLLLGLAREGQGVAAKALELLGIRLEVLRPQVEATIGRGQWALSGHIPFTPRAKKALELSLREGLELGHDYVGTEHLLLGLIREGEGVAAQVLVKLGADLPRARRQVIELLSGHAAGVEAGARTRLVRMAVPEDLREAEEQLAQVRRQKQAAIDAEEFDRAAALRDQERQLVGRVTERERAWTAGVDLDAVVQENHNLHGEVERLRELLRQHGVEPDGGTAQTG